MRVLYCWELGGGLGHLSRAYAFHEAAKTLNIDFALACKDAKAALEYFGPQLPPLYNAPIWRPRYRRRGPPLSYVDILCRHGWLSASGLANMAECWRTLFSLIQPDAVLFDYAPSALLAARGLEFQKIVVGTGFGILQPGQAILSFREQTRPEQVGGKSEEAILNTANSVLRAQGSQEIRHIGDLWQVDRTLITNFEELEIFDFEDVEFVGLLSGKQTTPPQSRIAAPEVFAYLKRSPHLQQILEGLARTGRNTLVYCPGVSDALKREFAGKLHFSTDPVDITTLKNSTRVIVSHGGPGILYEGFSQHIPALCIPLQLEQSFYARQIVKSGLGLAVSPRAPAADVAGAIQRLCEDDDIARHIDAVAERCRSHDSDGMALSILEQTRQRSDMKGTTS